jgi:hypothetical protein
MCVGDVDSVWGGTAAQMYGASHLVRRMCSGDVLGVGGQMAVRYLVLNIWLGA